MSTRSFLLYCAGALLLAGQAQAAPATLGAPVSFVPGACVTYGDFVSCSGHLLEGILNTANNVYTPPVGPGQLQDNIVIGDNPGNSPVNDLINSDSGTGIDNGYQTPTGVGLFDFSTKDSALGGQPDPSAPYPFQPEFIGDLQDFWDIRLDSLLAFLADPTGGPRSDLLIGFDHNQTGAGDGQDLLAWALVAISGPNLPDQIFELTNSGFISPLAFSSGKSLSSDPIEPNAGSPFGTPNDFVVSNGQICTAGPFTSQQTCQGAGGVWADANKGNNIDFILWSPEINAGLEGWLGAGYDSLHVRWDMRQLNDGPETAFLMPGRLTITVPEPESLLLLGIALVGLYAFRRRHVHHEAF